MKTLALRQAKRLAPPALAVVALGLLVYLVALGTSDANRALRLPPLEVAALLVLYVAPWLLGVAAIAPDAEAGGLTFLGTLPLGRRRHLAVRAGVAAASTLVVVAPFLLLVAVTSSVGLRDLEDHAARATVLFAAGLAAGAAARHSLGAFLAAPALLAAPVALYMTFLRAVGAPGEPFYAAAYPGVGVVLVLATVRAFADPGRIAWRPALRAVSVLAGAVALGCGATTVAWAAAIAFPQRSTFQWRIGDVVVMNDYVQPDWPNHPEVGRTTLLRSATPIAPDDVAAAAARGWRLDGDWLLAGVSPGGRVALLVARGYADDVQLVDVDARRVLATTTAYWLPLEAYGFGLQVLDDTSPDYGWIAERPWFVREDGVVQVVAGETLLRLTPGAQVHSVGGRHLLVSGAGPLRRVDVRDGSETPLDGVDAAELSPRGYLLITLERGRLVLRRLPPASGAGADEVLALDVGDAMQGTHVTVSFSHDERRVLVARQVRGDQDGAPATRRALLIDLVTGAQRDAGVSVRFDEAEAARILGS